jgi:hypothetical protein
LSEGRENSPIQVPRDNRALLRPCLFGLLANLLRGGQVKFYCHPDDRSNLVVNVTRRSEFGMTQRFARTLNPVWKRRGEACARPELQIAVALMRSNREYPLSATPTWKTTGKLAAQPGAFDFNTLRKALEIGAMSGSTASNHAATPVALTKAYFFLAAVLRGSPTSNVICRLTRYITTLPFETTVDILLTLAERRLRTVFEKRVTAT